MSTGKLFLLAAIATACTACTRTTTSSTTWVAEGNWVRPGSVESVREVVRRVPGDPAAGAAVGAAASSGRAETRTYQVLVRFDDGERGMFLYRDYSPFAPGMRVELTPQGLRLGP